MHESRWVDGQRAKDLIVSLGRAKTASDLCRNLVHLVLREFVAVASFICVLENDSTLLRLGQYGYAKTDQLPASEPFWRAGAITEAIQTNSRVTVENRDEYLTRFPSANLQLAPGEAFVAIPFNPSGESIGALGIAFAGAASSLGALEGEWQLIQAAAELVARRSLPRHPQFAARANHQAAEDSDLASLTERHIQILRLMAEGKTNAQIGRMLSLSESSIKQESVRVFRSLAVDSRHSAVSLARQLGLI
jgi:DNA-binding CsgD family transcriptional regulator